MPRPEVIITDEMRSPDERVKVHPFRHPWIKGTDIDPECGHTWHDHGWIDRGDHGFTVCPTQAVRPDVLRDRIYTSVGVHASITYDQGDERAALAALDRAYAELKRQITGMTTIVPGEHQED